MYRPGSNLARTLLLLDDKRILGVVFEDLDEDGLQLWRSAKKSIPFQG